MNNCLHCVNWSLRSNSEFAKHGFGRCELNEKWIFFGPGHSCEKFSKIDDEFLEKRKKWNDAHTKTFMATKRAQS